MRHSLAIAAVLLSGCAAHRYFTLPPGIEPEALSQSDVEHTWALGDVYVHSESPPLLQGAAQLVDYSQARDQLEQRITTALTTQPGLGKRVERRRDSPWPRRNSASAAPPPGNERSRRRAAPSASRARARLL